MSKKYFLREKVFLVGDIDTQIIGNKLPTNKQALKVLFFHIRHLKLLLRDSAILVVNEVKVFWEKAGIPVQDVHRCAIKLESLYYTWRSIQKHAGRASNTDKEKEDKFKNDLELLFDIAKSDEYLTIKYVSQEKIEFLSNQRSTRTAFINNIQTIHDEELTLEEVERVLEERKKAKFERETGNLDDVAQLIDSSPSQSQPKDSQGSIYSPSKDGKSKSSLADKNPGSIKKRGTINILNDKLVATLDKCQISARNAVRLISAIVESAGVDVESIVLNRESIHKYRQKRRKEMAEKIKLNFPLYRLISAVLHWDGKLLKLMQGGNKVDRVVIAISDGKRRQILAIPALEDGKGITQATALFDTLTDWGLDDRIQAICCDTTFSNLGPNKGAARLLEKMLDRDLLIFACRHHLWEIILSGVFKKLMPTSTGPTVPIFETFKGGWKNIDQSQFSPGVDDDYVRVALEDYVDDISSFINKMLSSNQQPRDDYNELLQLCLIFLGQIPQHEVKFYKPGATSHARWMAKAIYCLKIYLFREVFLLEKAELDSIRDICIFVIAVYIKQWFTAPMSISAPNNDLNFVKVISRFSQFNSVVSQIALEKFSNHMWYLSPEVAALSFFDDSISHEIKEKMANKIRYVENVDLIGREIPKRYHVSSISDFSFLLEKDMDYFITHESVGFFQRFEINYSFIKFHASQWHAHESYHVGQEIAANLTVVNDIAERGIKLISEYKDKLTTNEEEREYAIQVVDEYGKTYKDSNKATLIVPFEV